MIYIIRHSKLSQNIDFQIDLRVLKLLILILILGLEKCWYWTKIWIVPCLLISNEVTFSRRHKLFIEQEKSEQGFHYIRTVYGDCEIELGFKLLVVNIHSKTLRVYIITFTPSEGKNKKRNITTRQSMMNANLGKQRFWHLYEFDEAVF